jgi:hypothetical protein
MRKDATPDKLHARLDVEQRELSLKQGVLYPEVRICYQFVN